MRGFPREFCQGEAHEEEHHRGGYRRGEEWTWENNGQWGACAPLYAGTERKTDGSECAELIMLMAAGCWFLEIHGDGGWEWKGVVGVDSRGNRLGEGCTGMRKERVYKAKVYYQGSL